MKKSYVRALNGDFSRLRYILFILFAISLLPGCTEQAKTTILEGTLYNPDTIVPSFIVPPAKGMVVIRPDSPCDVEVVVYSISGTIKWKGFAHNVKGKTGIYLNTDSLVAGVYICRVKYLKQGKLLKETVMKFAFSKKDNR